MTAGEWIELIHQIRGKLDTLEHFQVIWWLSRILFENPKPARHTNIEQFSLLCNHHFPDNFELITLFDIHRKLGKDWKHFNWYVIVHFTFISHKTTLNQLNWSDSSSSSETFIVKFQLQNSCCDRSMRVVKNVNWNQKMGWMECMCAGQKTVKYPVECYAA